jgi:hypothetical protein
MQGKNLYHAFRLLGEAEHILNTGRPQVVIDNEEERAFLLSLRQKTVIGEGDSNDVAKAAKNAEALTRRIGAEYNKKSVPDRSFLNDWLFVLRMAHWQS